MSQEGDTDIDTHTLLIHIRYTHTLYTYVIHIHHTHTLHTYVIHHTHTLHTYFTHVRYTHTSYTYDINTDIIISQSCRTHARLTACFETRRRESASIDCKQLPRKSANKDYTHLSVSMDSTYRDTTSWMRAYKWQNNSMKTSDVRARSAPEASCPLCVKTLRISTAVPWICTRIEHRQN